MQRKITKSRPEAATKSKRAQVSRACDRCRQYRIKCDNDIPCKNCKTKGCHCTNIGISIGNRDTVPSSAAKEIFSLRERIKGLEQQLEKAVSDQTESSSSDNIDPSSRSNSIVAVSSMRIDSQCEEWGVDGVWTNNIEHQTRYFHGPSSLTFFINRLSRYFDSAMQQKNYHQYIQPLAPSKVFSSPNGPRRDDPAELSVIDGMYVDSDYLTRSQEDYFLNLFWETYNCTFPLIDEQIITDLYNSLWNASQEKRHRKPSPIVDIILALCLQYGTALFPRVRQNKSSKTDLDMSDPSVAGRSYYRRCQILLTFELERPSLTTLQCHILCVVYLMNASFQNTAQQTLAVAVRTAFLFGLHREPPKDLPLLEQELRRRLWWIIFTLEAKTGIYLGRPWMIDMSIISCRPPTPDNEVTSQSSVRLLSPIQNISWLTYHFVCVKFVVAVREIHTSFRRRLNSIANGNGLSQAEISESLASSLSQDIYRLQEWEQNLPEGMKIKRKNDGTSYSTDKSLLQLDPRVPVWLKRQQILMEINYHDQMMNLFTPFIRFQSKQQSITPLTDGHALSSMAHAIAITQIIHQIVSETDIFNGWYDVYKFQWNASLSLVGFCFAYPLNAATISARQIIDKAIDIFVLFGNSFAIASSAANVLRDLSIKVDLFINGIIAGMPQPFAGEITQSPPPYSIFEFSRDSRGKNSKDNDRSTNANDDGNAEDFVSQLSMDLLNFSEPQYLEGLGVCGNEQWTDFLTNF
ncbi:fungal-specific transcription factor domain-containing protein [Dipodascopsis uninucleata]